MCHDSLIADRSETEIHLLTLNRPEALNAIDMDLARRLFDALDTADADPAARCIIISGTGDKAFSAGFDIREMQAFDEAAMLAAFEYRDPLMRRIAAHRLPVIAAVNGLAFGAGALIAAAADLRVASANARFKVTAVAYGGANATWSLPALVGRAKAMEILMTGREVGADEGLSLGLYNRVVPVGSVVDEALALSRDIARHPPEGVAGIKALVGSNTGLSKVQGWQAEFDYMRQSLARGSKQGAEVFGSFKPSGGSSTS